ncbi:unnamed protein product [Prorocentrum cordatum]|uniref:Kinesin motor domain-containing protein n=1 Tax=Prorocentrum cordatum TaxID=2364126 RepID=A0ABN9X3F6_9DINO|nr:unnamed protein product [Polarella glacialis]
MPRPAKRRWRPRGRARRCLPEPGRSPPAALEAARGGGGTAVSRATPQGRHQDAAPRARSGQPAEFEEARPDGVGHAGGGRRRASAPFVSVALRVRPAPATASGDISVWAKPPEEGGARQRMLCCSRGYVVEEYEFSRVFGPADDNRALFHDMQGPALTSSVFGGVNETLFAYGQTGSGKTHTIFGSGEEAGLLGLFVDAFFQQAEAFPGSSIHVCCYEVFGDTLTDLVNPRRPIEQGNLHSDDVVTDEVFVKTRLCQYQIVRVSRVETCLDLLHEARANRAKGVSSCNSSSSRSHAVVHLFVQNPTVGAPRHHDSEGGRQSTIGALTLVDLAGTEREHDNPSDQGKKSARLLNTSLSSLNRLLRKLQTNSLDESERRQSVLNKCLWEYLRPGCGIAMVFCVSPLAKHRSTTLSTLAMATDSKLIRSQRKSHYVQIPDKSQPSGTCPNVQCIPVQSPRAAPSPLAPRGPEGPPPRSGPRGTPGRPASSGASAAGGRGPERGASRRSRAGEDELVQSWPAGELETPTGLDLGCPQTVRSLSLQITELRRRLRRARARSADRDGRAERDREQLGADLDAARRECETLRALFIRQQQQQQTAFWTGPFLDLLAPRDAALAAGELPPRPRPPQAAAEAVRSPVLVWAPRGRACGGSPAGATSAHPPAARPPGSGGGAAALPPPAPATDPPPHVPPKAARLRGAGAPPAPMLGTEGGGSTCLDAILLERDYWRAVASGLQRGTQGESQRCSERSSGKAPGLWDCGGSSTSQTLQETVGDPSPTAWSDTGSELSLRSSAAEA